MPRTRGKSELKPLYDMTRSLDIKYRFNDQEYESASLTLPGAETHASLANACNTLLSLRNEKYTRDISDINLATATLTFLYTDTQTEEGYLGEDIEQSCYYIHAEIPERIVNTKSFYTDTYQLNSFPKKGIRDNGFNQLLSDRIIAFSNISHSYDCKIAGLIPDQPSLDIAIGKGNFHETFHHSEQALMHWMSSRQGIKSLTNFASSIKAKYVYGVVLDIYTQRTLCCNCNACLLGMQVSHEQGFLSDFSNALIEKTIQPRTHNMMLSTRVSASKQSKNGTSDVFKLKDDGNVVHRYNPDRDNKILQAKNSHLHPRINNNKKNPSLESFPGSFFASRHFAKVRLEKDIKIEPSYNNTAKKR